MPCHQSRDGPRKRLWRYCRNWRRFALIAAIVAAAGAALANLHRACWRVLRKITPKTASSGKRRIRASRDDGPTRMARSERAKPPSAPDQEAFLDLQISRLRRRSRSARACGAGAGQDRLCRPGAHGDGHGGKPRRRRTPCNRLCPSPGPHGQTRRTRSQAHDRYHRFVRLRDRHQHAAGRRRRSRRRVWARGLRH